MNKEVYTRVRREVVGQMVREGATHEDAQWLLKNNDMMRSRLYDRYITEMAYEQPMGEL